MGDTKLAGADADRQERAAECHQHRQILFPEGGEVKENPVTGNRVIHVRRGTFRQIEAPVTLRHPEAVIGEKLTAKLDSTGLMIDFRWVRMEPTDEADARDVQSRA